MNAIGLSGFKDLTAQGYVVVDTRQPEMFCEGFIKDSISIPFNENFIVIFQELIEDEQKVLLVSDEHDIPVLTSTLKYAGISTVAGFLEKGFENWQGTERKTDMLITVEPDEFAIDYKFDEFYLIDVRSSEDFEKEHIEDAENIPFAEIEKLILSLEADGNYYLYAETFAEAVTSGALFKRNGFERVRVVSADYAVLKESKLPVYTPKKKDKSSNKFSNN